jgi:hypothetical protein
MKVEQLHLRCRYRLVSLQHPVMGYIIVMTADHLHRSKHPPTAKTACPAVSRRTPFASRWWHNVIVNQLRSHRYIFLISLQCAASPYIIFEYVDLYHFLLDLG